MFVLDTNILISYAAGDEKVSSFIFQALEESNRIFISAISVIEFLSFPKLPAKDKEFFSLLLQELSIMPLDFEHAVMAGQIRAKYRMKLADSVVAATAVLAKSLLVSRDRDFKKIKEIETIDL
jgi:hypothetical protein